MDDFISQIYCSPDDILLWGMFADYLSEVGSPHDKLIHYIFNKLSGEKYKASTLTKDKSADREYLHIVYLAFINGIPTELEIAFHYMNNGLMEIFCHERQERLLWPGDL